MQLLARKALIASVFMALLALLGCAILIPLPKRGLGITDKYVRLAHWPNLPDTVELGNPTGIGINKQGQLVVFHRTKRKWPTHGPVLTNPIRWLEN
jgi:hypothetical protein